MTDGSKFGADYLLYPGDPLLYHAQFTVRVLEHQAAIKPALLIGGARGSHSARKHLLLASVGSMQQARSYMFPAEHTLHFLRPCFLIYSSVILAGWFSRYVMHHCGSRRWLWINWITQLGAATTNSSTVALQQLLCLYCMCTFVLSTYLPVLLQINVQASEAAHLNTSS